MNRIVSTLPRALSSLLLVLLVLLFVLSGAACRGDDAGALGGADEVVDDSDASPVAGAIQGSFAVATTGEAT